MNTLGCELLFITSLVRGRRHVGGPRGEGLRGPSRGDGRTARWMWFGFRPRRRAPGFVGSLVPASAWCSTSRTGWRPEAMESRDRNMGGNGPRCRGRDCCRGRGHCGGGRRHRRCDAGRCATAHLTTSRGGKHPRLPRSCCAAQACPCCPWVSAQLSFSQRKRYLASTPHAPRVQPLAHALSPPPSSRTASHSSCSLAVTARRERSANGMGRAQWQVEELESMSQCLQCYVCLACDSFALLNERSTP